MHPLSHELATFASVKQGCGEPLCLRAGIMTTFSSPLQPERRTARERAAPHPTCGYRSVRLLIPERSPVRPGCSERLPTARPCQNRLNLWLPFLSSFFPPASFMCSLIPWGPHSYCTGILTSGCLSGEPSENQHIPRTFITCAQYSGKILSLLNASMHGYPGGISKCRMTYHVPSIFAAG